MLHLLAIAVLSLAPGRVDDQAHVLSEEQAADIAVETESLEADTGVSIYVVTTARSNGRLPRELAIDYLAAAHAPPRSVVMMVLIDQHVVWIVPEDGLANVFTPEVCHTILDRDVLPVLRERKWAKGIALGVTDMGNAVKAFMPAKAPISNGLAVPVAVQQPSIEPVPITHHGMGVTATVLCVVGLGMLGMALLLVYSEWKRRRASYDRIRDDWQPGPSSVPTPMNPDRGPSPGMLQRDESIDSPHWRDTHGFRVPQPMTLEEARRIRHLSLVERDESEPVDGGPILIVQQTVMPVAQAPLEVVPSAPPAPEPVISAPDPSPAPSIDTGSSFDSGGGGSFDSGGGGSFDSGGGGGFDSGGGGDFG